MTHIIESIPYDPNVSCVGKAGGYPTYEPTEGYDSSGYFLMELYNNDFIHGKEEIICWQFYQSDERGGIIESVVPIYKGAQLLSSPINKRRWLKEFSLVELSPEEIDDFSYRSSFGDPIEEWGVEHCKNNGLEYVGVIRDLLCNEQIRTGTTSIYFGFDENGDLQVIYN